MLAMCPIFAKLLEVNAGLVGFFDKPLVEVPNTTEVAMDDFTFGAAADVKASILIVNASALYSQADGGSLKGLLSANIGLDLFMIRAEVGVGFDYKYSIATNEFYFHGLEDPESMLTDPVTLRAAVSFMLDDIHFQVFATSNTGNSIMDIVGNYQDVDMWNEYLNNASCGIAVKLNLI